LQQPGGGLNDSRYDNVSNSQFQQQAMPKTATGSSFNYNYQNPDQRQQQNHSQNQNQNQYNMPGGNQFYSPDQILAPPSIQIGDAIDENQMDPQTYEELMRTNQYLAEQQMRLQQQLINVTAAASQFQNMNLGQNQESAYAQMNMNPSLGFYSQQLSQGMQPVVQEVPGNPGLYTVYNPMTGQTTLCYDSDAVAAEQYEMCQSPPASQTNFRGRLASPPPQSPSPHNAVNKWRTSSPPKVSTTPPREDATPLPPPSATAFRPSHRKNNLSLAHGATSAPVEGLRTGGLKSAGFPQTPMTGTFGPGQAREGEHPVRQPRGPPSMEELTSKPTNKFEGSKNFASRQRRGALNQLVRAGKERRGGRGSGSLDRASSGSPTSQHNRQITASPDNDNVSVRSGSASLDGQPEDGARSPLMSAIGSERKELKERSRERIPSDSQYTAISVSSEDDNTSVGGKLLEIKFDDTAKDNERRKSPLALLANAEKRRSFIM
jgi:hypothetical protein